MSFILCSHVIRLVDSFSFTTLVLLGCFLCVSVSNPFGGSSNTTLSSQSGVGGVSQQPSANPFGSQQPVNSSGFGAFGTQNAPASQTAGFGQFGAPTGSSGAGFGQFGTPASSAGTGFGQFGTQASTANAGFGQFGAQNGGFGANTPATGFGGAQTTMSTGFGAQQGFGAGQPGFGQQQQQQAGFGGAGFGVQPTQGFPQQQPAGFGGQTAQMQGFGGAQGWGQMPAPSGSANPFMVGIFQHCTRIFLLHQFDICLSKPSCQCWSYVIINHKNILL